MNGYRVVRNFLSAEQHARFVEGYKKVRAAADTVNRITPGKGSSLRMYSLEGELSKLYPSKPLGSYLIDKEPHGAALPWHHDFTGVPSVFVNVYLQDTKVKNGCLRVLPGSHLNQSAPYGYTDQSNADRIEGEVDVELDKLDVVIGDSRLWHSTHPNLTDEWRVCIVSWFEKVPMLEEIYEAHAALPDDKTILGDDVIEEEDRGAAYLQAKETYAWYAAVAAAVQPRSVVEIGVRYGYSAIALRRGHYFESYTGFDMEEPDWPGCLERAYKNMVFAFGWVANTMLVRENTQTIDSLPKCDLVHVDGDHSYAGCLHDLRMAWDAASKAVIVDDYNSGAGRVDRAVKDFCEEKGIPFYVLPSYNGLAFIPKQKAP